MAAKKILEVSGIEANVAISNIVSDMSKETGHVEKLDAIFQILLVCFEKETIDGRIGSEKISVRPEFQVSFMCLQKVSALCRELMSVSQENDILQKCVEIVKLLCSKMGSEDVQVILHHCIELLKISISQSESLPGARLAKIVHLVSEIVSHNSHLCKLEMYKSLEDLFFKSLISDSESVSGVMLSLILPVIIANMDKVQVLTVVLKIWDVVKSLFQMHGQKTYHTLSANFELSERPYLILCGASNVLFPVPTTTDNDLYLVEDETFWSIIQSGFFHQSSLSRKRSLYLLKRIIDVLSKGDRAFVVETENVPIFQWSADNKEKVQTTWTDFILLMETLEEKQVHMIKPLMPKLDKLIAATEKAELSPLHSSWVTLVFQRLACHHTMFIQRWGVCKFLSIDFAKFPLHEQDGKQFLSGPFIAMLTETTVYYKPVEVGLGDPPPVVVDLAMFFKNYFASLDQKEKSDLLRSIFKGIKGHFWSGASLVYVMRGLAHIETSPVIDMEILQLIRELLISVIPGLDSHFRGAIMEYLTTTVLQLLDKESVAPLDIASFLGLLSSSECLMRENSLWKTVKDWLNGTVNGSRDGSWSKDNILSEIVKAVEETIKKPGQFSVNDLTGLIRLILQIVDGGIVSISNTPETYLTTILTPILDIANKMGSHLYMVKSKAEQAVVFLKILLKEVQTANADEDDFVVQYLQSLSDGALITSILQFFSRSLSEVTTGTDVDSALLYSEFIDAYSSFSRTTLSKFRSNPELLNLVNSCITNLSSIQQVSQKGQLSLCCSMVILSEVCKILDTNVYKSIIDFFKGWTVCSDFKKPSDLDTDQSKNVAGTLDWGRISSIFLERQWSCIFIVLKTVSSKEINFNPEDAIFALDILGGWALLPVFNSFGMVLHEISENMIVDLIRLGWNCVQDNKRSNTYWPLYTAYLDMLLQPCTLQALQGSMLYEKLQWLCKEILKLGEDKLGLVYVLITKLCDWWKQSEDNLKYAHGYQDTIIKAVMFGEIHSKGKRFENEVHQYLLKGGKYLAVNRLIDCSFKEDSMVRVCMLTFLSRLQPGILMQAKLGISICEKLINLQKETLELTSYRNFGNSLTHRRKHRLFCTLMIMHRFLEKEQDLLDQWHNMLLDMLSHENQPSVRNLVEWMYIRLVHGHPNYIPVLWENFQKSNEKKPVLMCSLLSVITHLAKLQPGKNQQDFIMDSLPKVFPWATAAQFNIRLFAQGCITVMWNISVEQGHTKVLHTHSIMKSFITFCKGNSQAEKALQRLLQNFFYYLHPSEDFCIESLVHTIPYLSGLTDEEWILPSRFEKFSDSWSEEGEHSLPLWSKSDQLKKCTPGTWRVKFSGKDEEWLQETSNVQKKMIPWRNMLPEETLDPEMSEEYTKKRQTTGCMVLCASLIDKIPNLGGLCRTGEIFGVSEYVVGSMKYVEDKNFESLSVTAHKWLPIKEVKPHFLKQYMVEMKEEGYTLIGAEQTANSVSLTDYKFPKKTLLLLGNEKEGIPVELIQLLDVCVEIPQQGVVRSLNVHVSGALLVWEYTRQHLFTDQNAFKT